ncbi:hypothetical protein [uncultured Succinatimonas sp.]|uniref:hypothetical protein n=3 Tax=uncultured Succinatimonas sp. TaxID=1262973 RepID=UPI002601632F|nr:hypothetical protein [uncultured Succinatimonas sp.]
MVFMSNSPEIIKNAVDFTKAQSEGLGFHLNSKNEIKTHGKFTAFLYQIRDLFRFQTTINAEKAKLSEALQNILSSHYGITADPGSSPNLSPAELDNLKHNIKLASDSAANFNKPGVDVKKLENAIHARLGTDLSPKEFDTVKKEILRYGNSQLEAMRSLELKLQRQAADKNGAYLMSSSQIEDYEGLVESFLAEKASGSTVKEGANLSAKSAVITDEKELLSVIEFEIKRIADLYAQSVPKNLDAAVKEIRDFCSEGMTKDQVSETVNDAIVAGLLNKYAFERLNESNSTKEPTKEEKIRTEIESEIKRIADLYDQRVPNNLDAAVKEIKDFYYEGMPKHDLSSIINDAIVAGLLKKTGAQGGSRAPALQEKTMPDCQMPAQNGNHIIQGQFFRQQPLSNTCFILSIFNGLCSSEQGARWLNDHVTQDLVQKGTLHFHPRDAENKDSDFEIDIHTPEVQQVRNQVLSRKGLDCMSDFEAACAHAYMKYFDDGFGRAYVDPMVKEIGFTPDPEEPYIPGDLGEAIVMANILGLYVDTKSIVEPSSLKENRQRVITMAQDFLRNHKGIILLHKNSLHFTAVQDVRDNGDFVELDSLNESGTRLLEFDDVANRPINLIFISFTQENQFNAEDLHKV